MLVFPHPISSSWFTYPGSMVLRYEWMCWTFGYISISCLYFLQSYTPFLYYGNWEVDLCEGILFSRVSIFKRC